MIDEIKKFVYKTKPKSDKKKQEKEDTINNLCNFFDPRKMVLHGFKSKIFLTKSKGSDILNSDQSKLKILTPKQMLQRLPIALALVKAGNNSENLLNEIRNYLYEIIIWNEIIYSLYEAKEITKKVYNHLMKSL